MSDVSNSSSSARPARARLSDLQIVRRIDEFLQEHFGEPIYMAQLCMATGVSERSVRNACHAVCGTSPKRYLTRRRMEAVRRALAAAPRGQATVTRLATEYGFYELGRFAGIYNSIFGEHPSDTLRANVDRA